jgi:hypothetical protein
MFDRADRYTYGLVPWTAFIEAGLCSQGACTGNGPTAAQVKMESWLAVIHGMKGIFWWGPEGWTVQDSAHWKTLARFVTDCKTFKDVILSTTTRTVASDKTVTHNRVDAMVKEDAGNVYVFAARLSDVGEDGDPAINSQLSVSGLIGTRTVTVYNENRTLSSANGVFSDTFVPSAVHIYKIGLNQTGITDNSFRQESFRITIRLRGTGFSVALPSSVRSPELTVIDLSGRTVFRAMLNKTGESVFNCTWHGAPAAGSHFAVVKETLRNDGAVLARTKFVEGK